MRYLLTLGFFFSSVAFADFSGAWTGSGTALYNFSKDDVWDMTCSKINYDFTQTATEFIINSAMFDCTSDDGQVQVEWPTATYQIENGELKENGKVVGTITDTKIHMDLGDATEDWKDAVDFEITEAGLSLNLVGTNYDGSEPFFSAKGMMTK
jgi:hypothetical protein